MMDTRTKLQAMTAVRSLATPATPTHRYYAMVTHPGVGRYVIDGSHKGHVAAALAHAVASGHVNPSKIRARW